MGQARTVLVVDDDAAIRDVVTMALEDVGYQVDTASDGAEGLRQADHHQPDAVVLDAMMPVMNGWQFLERWRVRSAATRSPVVMVSAVGNRRAALESGAQGYLSKPFDLDALEAALTSVL